MGEGGSCLVDFAHIWWFSTTASVIPTAEPIPRGNRWVHDLIDQRDNDTKGFGGYRSVLENILQRFPWILALASVSRHTRRPVSPAKHNFWRRSSAVLSLFFVLISGALPIDARDEGPTFKIPPVKIPLNIKDQHVTIAASALVTMVAQDRGLNVLKLRLTADLADLQQNMTAVLSSELDKNDRCGDRIAVEHATLTPHDPASLVVVQLHYERWVCTKVFGKQEAKRLLGGNAVMQMKLTPAVEENNTGLRLVPEVGSIEADGSLGELLRSGTLGEMLREKIRTAILSAAQKGTDLGATLPPAIQGYATIQNAQFKDAGSGRLIVILDGEARITNEQIQALSKQVKERIAPQ
jgi:hypothetical protein